MVVENPKNRIDGSAALAPEINVVPKREEREQQRKHREEQRKLRTQKRNMILKYTGTTILAGALAVAIVGRYSAMYKNQKQINELKDQIAITQASSEDLRIKLLQFNNISFVEETAKNTLGMVDANGANAMYSDIDGIEFINPDVEESKASQGILSKIKKILFN